MSTVMNQIIANVATHREQMEVELVQAIHHREHAKAVFEDADGRVRAIEYLLRTLDHGEGPRRPRSMKLHDAMVEVLNSDPVGMLRAVHLAAAINERGLYRMQDGRPVEGQQITARVGRYPQLFEREGTFIKLKR